jgi:uncharacterized phage protein (TIGR01671 family)
MTREIKFRAWDVITEKMHTNIRLKNMDEHLRSFDEIDLKLCHLKFMQYTGLRDNSAKEIYEGDIIQVTKFLQNEPMLDSVLRVVEFEYARFILVDVRDGIDNSLRGTFFEPEEEYEVIGDIYTTPELLEDKDGKNI